MEPNKVLKYTLIVSIGGFLFGFDASVISGVLIYITPDFDLDPLNTGWVVSSPAFSAMFAMLSSGLLSDRIGRKKTLQIVAVIYFISALLSTISQSIVGIALARMLGGLAFGGALIVVPIYISEIAPADKRGRLVSLQQLNIVFGFLAAYFSNYLITLYFGASIHEDLLWRLMLGVEIAPALLYLILLRNIPESPVWEHQQKKRNVAPNETIGSKFFGWIRIQRIYLQELWSPSWRNIFLIAIFIGIIQQITGINAIFFYATSIFEKTGVGIDASLAQTVIIGVVNIVFTLVALITIDRLGRRFLLLAGLAGIIISMGITSYGFMQQSYQLSNSIFEEIEVVEHPSMGIFESISSESYQNEDDFKLALERVWSQYHESDLEPNIYAQLVKGARMIEDPWMVLMGILGFVASFACSLGPVMWVLLSELFSDTHRGLAISIVGFLNSLASWLTQFLFPLELNILGDSFTYGSYAVIALIGWIVIYYYLPETKNKLITEVK
jgi:MFS family permease